MGALYTPGHAAGHLCYYEVERHHLLSGDNVLGVGTSLVPPAPHGHMASYLQGLRRLLALPINLVLPGHGPPTALGAERVADTLAQREARERALLELLPNADEWPFELLLARLYRGINVAQRPLAALSLRSHLEKLAAEGLVALAAGSSVATGDTAPATVRWLGKGSARV